MRSISGSDSICRLCTTHFISSTSTPSILPTSVLVETADHWALSQDLKFINHCGRSPRSAMRYFGVPRWRTRRRRRRRTRTKCGSRSGIFKERERRGSSSMPWHCFDPACGLSTRLRPAKMDSSATDFPANEIRTCCQEYLKACFVQL